MLKTAAFVSAHRITVSGEAKFVAGFSTGNGEGSSAAGGHTPDPRHDMTQALVGCVADGLAYGQTQGLEILEVA
ncbi:hypothetical protein [Actinomadura sp. 3N407]|uniref:hypothetical protein n=1 Tax=Actinomadura sp. 3N407 TaxID=3457423 RepID=UPI003FCCC793